MEDKSILTTHRIFNSKEFDAKTFGPARWLEDDDGYTTLETAASDDKVKEIIRIYKTGIAVAAVSDQRYYDTIYQERYMGLPQENEEGFKKGSPITYAGQLEGKLLIIHGTADDNVHYQCFEALVNQLIKHDRQFSMMAYPNRSHAIKEGKNTQHHLYSLMTRY
jgi:dipeptidyl aminopeptidase/acylaminoacyl peptidase